MKSYVTLEQKVCAVCCKEYDTNSLLLDRRLKERFDMHTVTGFGLCPEHEDLRERGYTALVACDPEKSFTSSGQAGVKSAEQVIKPQDAYRTGRVAHLKHDAFKGIFGQEPPPGGVVFCDDEVLDKLEEMEKQRTVQDGN